MIYLNKPIRLGIIGCGSFVQRRILPVLKKTNVISVEALQKRNFLEVKQIAKEYNIPFACTTRDELLKIPQVDAILIASTNEQHEEDAIACAAHSKPTLCEKPLASSVTAIERMIKAFENQNLTLCVGHSLRFKCCIQKAKELLQTEKLGQLLSIRAYFAIPLPKDNWRYQKAKGGGVLQDIGIHLIDLIRFISGQEIHSIFAKANHDYKIFSPQAEHTVTAICELTNQVVCSFECSFTQPYANSFEIIGTKARIVSNNSLIQSDTPNESFYMIENDVKLSIPISISNIYLDELLHFADILQGSKSIIPASEGLQNQKVVEAAYFSIKKNCFTKVR